MGNIVFKDASSGIVDVPGFQAAGVHCDVRGKSDGRLDLAVIYSKDPCVAAGVFTRNRVAAAPVRLCREQLAAGEVFKGIVANSGNANACTGEQGMRDAVELREAAAEALGCDPVEILVCSTGRIGQRLPMERLGEGVREGCSRLSQDPESGLAAADAILTSDTRRKCCTVNVQTRDGDITIAGIAKGAGMIEPDMATMLAFIATDAECDRISLQQLLKESAGASFNAVTVDGDESTNDTALLLANGASGIRMEPGAAGWSDFTEGVRMVCMDLARKIVGDGEKITKVVEVCIESAATREDACRAARAVANSLLVKSSWYGNDPNWGRVMDALGYSGAELSEDSVQLSYAEAGSEEKVPVFSRGEIYAENREEWGRIVANKEFRIVADLGKGRESCTVWSTDLTEGYVNFNKSE